MSKSYIETNLYTKELEKEINDSTVYPLIKQLHMLYGLKVYQRFPISYRVYPGEKKNNIAYSYGTSTDSEIFKPNEDVFLMGTQGIPELLVYWDTEEEKYSVHHKQPVKYRGKNGWERRTISSKNIPQVIKSINKKNINYNGGHGFPIDIRDIIETYKVKGNNIDGYKNNVSNHQRELTYSSNALSSVRALVDNVYGNKKPISHEQDTFFKEYIDKTQQLCHAYESAKKIAETDAMSGFYAFGINKYTRKVIQGEYPKSGEPIATTTLGEDRYKNLNLENSKIIKQIEDSEFYKDVEPILTMLKVKLDEQSSSVIEDYWLNTNYTSWVEDLGVLYKYSDNNSGSGSNQNPFDMKWLLISKGEECNTEESKME